MIEHSVESPVTPHSDTYAEATEKAFGRCPTFNGLRLLSVESRSGFLVARFEGPVSDFRGPYGAIIRLPQNQYDEQWIRYAGSGTVDDWVHAAVARRAVHAHTASINQDRGYSPDGTWWLIEDTTPQ